MSSSRSFIRLSLSRIAAGLNEMPLPVERLREQLTVALLSFVNDPPDTDFQAGYLAALRWVQETWTQAYNDNEVDE